MKPARVIGGGLSGLAAAWCLADAGFAVELADARTDLGGLIGSVATGHGLVERAANAFAWNDTVERWFSALGIRPQFAVKTSARRFIFRGRPRRWPLGHAESAGLLLRVASNWARGRLRPAGDENVRAWGDRALGRAATTWLVEPALQGIYGATADRLAARAIFGSSRGRSRRLASPPGGMGEFVGRLGDALRARGTTFALGQPIDAIDPSVPTIICTDAPTAAALLAPHAPDAAAAVQAVAMGALVTATAFFAPHPRDLRGFGVLFPRAAGVRALGVLFNADIFDGRSDVRSETWIYSAAEGTAPTESEVVTAVLADRTVLAGRTDAPLAIFVGGREASPTGTAPVPVAWLPVYDQRVLRIREGLGPLRPGLELAGNYLGRLGVAKLLDVAAEAAGRLTSATSSGP